MSKVVIVGGGASGLITSIYARKKSHEVIVIEKLDKCGKKILATGNGRCNYWNSEQNLNHYHSLNQEILNQMITEKDKKEVLEFFSSIGIIPKIKNGYYYPSSNQASSIRDALVLQAKLVGVHFITDQEVVDIRKNKNKFIVVTDKEEILSDKVVLATGSHAGVKDEVNGYDLALKFGHTIIDVLPALVQLKANETFLRAWSGIRSDVCIKLYENNEFVKEESGEIQLTDYGISGICTFNLSHIVSRGLKNKKQEHVVIDFLPFVETNSITEFTSWIEERNKLIKNRTLLELFEGILNYKLIAVLLNRSHINSSKHWNQLKIEEKRCLAQNIKYFHLDIIGTNPYIKAQVCSGGVSLKEINPMTLESLKEEGLYFVGEILDVDGDCGGYNLSFAWISGMKCGKNI